MKQYALLKPKSRINKFKVTVELKLNQGTNPIPIAIGRDLIVFWALFLLLYWSIKKVNYKVWIDFKKKGIFFHYLIAKLVKMNS